ncbi:MAG: hypothetical protein COV48_00185 [Elusimicrobia bacterium CG11_big_fil_rev_8_21_14_0_20_64_6]|nr:MAG: hypothetical protein COV48_00185 [Elusimicrobia bacterium CG11_big_fil_rev_8_21_14_0_20_64_6]
MGQRIWAVLEEYAGLWVTVDKSGRVVDHAETLAELTQRAGQEAHRLTFVFAAGQRETASV